MDLNKRCDFNNHKKSVTCRFTGSVCGMYSLDYANEQFVKHGRDVT